MELAIGIFLSILGIYTAIGVLFGLYFLFFGASKIDPLLSSSKKGIRLLLMPGVMATWPFFIKKLFKTKFLSS